MEDRAVALGAAMFRRRSWFEVALSGASGVLLVLTMLVRDWIEVVFHVDPDQHSGALEWAIVATFAATTVVFGLLARRDRRIAVTVEAAQPAP